MDVASSLFLTDILRIISDALLAPVMIILIILIIFGLWSIGTVIAEYFTERRNYRVAMPELLEEMACAEPAEMPHVIAESGLLRRQKTALLTLWDFRVLPEETFVALAKRVIATEDLFYRRKADWQASASKIAPMFGLMGTLIPLGPGIVALGQNNIDVLAASIGTAFYTTVAGLVSAAVFYVISKVRQSWYEEYMTSLETAATSIIEVVEEMRAEGGVDISEPGDSVDELGFADKRRKMRKLAEEVAAQSTEVARKKGKRTRRAAAGADPDDTADLGELGVSDADDSDSSALGSEDSSVEMFSTKEDESAGEDVSNVKETSVDEADISLEADEADMALEADEADDTADAGDPDGSAGAGDPDGADDAGVVDEADETKTEVEAGAKVAPDTDSTMTSGEEE